MPNVYEDRRPPVVNYGRPTSRPPKLPSQRGLHVTIVFGSTALSIVALFLGVVLSPILIALAIGFAFHPAPARNSWFFPATFAIWPICLLAAVLVRRSGRWFKSALMLSCLAPGIGWGTACIVTEHNFRRHAGLRVLGENLKLPQATRLHRCRWETASGVAYVSFEMAPPDLNQLLASNQFARITIDQLDPNDGFRSPATPVVGKSDELYQGKNLAGSKCVILVNREHTAAIFHAGG